MAFSITAITLLTVAYTFLVLKIGSNQSDDLVPTLMNKPCSDNRNLFKNDLFIQSLNMSRASITNLTDVLATQLIAFLNYVVLLSLIFAVSCINTNDE